MMMYPSLRLVLLITGSSTATAFHTSSIDWRQRHVTTSLFETTSTSSSTIDESSGYTNDIFPTQEERLDRALDCSQESDLCDVDEMLALADELGSLNDAACGSLSEVHLADVLRLEAQLSFRRQNVRERRIFRKDIESSLAMASRDRMMELIGLF